MVLIFRSEESQEEYFDAYEKTMQLFPVRVEDEYVDTEFGKSYVIKCGNVENYIGWGSEKEGKLPDSIITQFTLSVMNMNSNASFPKWLSEKQLRSIDMPVLLLFGENEFAFAVPKGQKRAKKCIQHLEMEVVQNASHLIPVSKPEYVNERILQFLEEL